MSLLYRKYESELLYLQKKMCECFTAGEDYATNREERNGASNASSESGLYLAQTKQTMQTDHVIDKDSSVQAVHMQSTFGYCYLSRLNV